MQSASDTGPSQAPRGSYGELLRLAGPTVMSRIGIMAMGLTDAIVVGQYSAVELGYHSLGWAPTMTVLVAALGLLLGVQVLTARHVGAGQPERTGAVLRRGVRYAFFIGVISSLGLALLGPWALRHMGMDPELAAGAARPLVILSLSLTPYLIADCLWLWLEALGKPNVPLTAMWVANLINLGLALWLVPGNSPFPVAGAVAAAWVTLAARLSFMLMLGIYILRWSRGPELGLYGPLPHEPLTAREQRRIGYATGLSFGIEAGSFAAMNFVAAQLGVLVVAGWAIVMNVASIMFMVPLGIATATAVLVSRAVGARDIAAVRRAYAMGMQLAFLLVAALSVLVFLLPHHVVAAYSSDPLVVPMAVAALLWACLGFVTDGGQVVTASVLRARGDIWWATYMHVISYIFVMIGLSWYLGVWLGFGLNGIVWAVVFASVLSCAALVARFYALGDRITVRS